MCARSMCARSIDWGTGVGVLDKCVLDLCVLDLFVLDILIGEQELECSMWELGVRGLTGGGLVYVYMSGLRVWQCKQF